MARISNLLTDEQQTLGDKRESRHFVTALARGLEVLSLFSRDVTELGNEDIARRTQLPRSTITRLTYTLVTTRHLVYMRNTGKYRLGAAALTWSYAASQFAKGIETLKPLLQEFADQMEASTVAVSVNVGLEMVYVAHCPGPSLFSIRTGVGTRLKLWDSACGRTFWSAVDPVVRERLRSEIEQLDEATRDRAFELLREAEQEYERFGFCTSLGGWRPGVNAAGCAIPAHGFEGASDRYVITCGGTSPEFDVDTIYNVVGPKLRDFAHFLAPQLA